jgi:hypothetical protein
MIYHDKDEIKNVYAYNDKQKEIFILDPEVKSGRSGYFCMGCSKEMQAVLQKNPKRKSYFRHHPNFVNSEHKCTYSDETYRHKLAIELISLLRRVKVPPVIKSPPPGVKGVSYILSEAKFIEPATVKKNIEIYENEDCQICWGKKPNSYDSHLIFRPDIVFFNKSYKPILFIEIEATHKVTLEKRLKIKRIGIDTINITVPQVSPKEIEKIFSQTSRTKWIYNYEEANTEYLSVSSGNTATVPELDEIQRKLFEESFDCRKAEINDLIRAIRRCLGSKPYGEIESAIRSALSRVERTTEEHRGRLEHLRNDRRDRIARRFGEQEDILRSEEKKFHSDENDEQNKHKELEERYLKKRGELEQQKDDLEFEEREINEAEERLEHRKGEFGDEIAREERSIENRGATIRREEGDLNRTIETEGFRTENEKTITEGLPGLYRQREAWVRQDFERKMECDREALRRDQEYRESIPEKYEQIRKELERRFELLRSEVAGSIEKRDDRPDHEFAYEFNRFFKAVALLPDYTCICDRVKKLRIARKSLENSDYKNWPEFKRRSIL